MSFIAPADWSRTTLLVTDVDKVCWVVSMLVLERNLPCVWTSAICPVSESLLNLLKSYDYRAFINIEQNSARAQYLLGQRRFFAASIHDAFASNVENGRPSCLFCCFRIYPNRTELFPRRLSSDFRRVNHCALVIYKALTSVPFNVDKKPNDQPHLAYQKQISQWVARYCTKCC